MIKSFKSNTTEEIFRARPALLRSQVERAARRALRRLDRAKTVQDFGMPLQRAAMVAPNEAILYNIAVGDQCRICFEWRDGDAYNVEVVIDAGRSPEARTTAREIERNAQLNEGFSVIAHSLDAEDDGF
jgi:toxin HigB-1